MKTKDKSLENLQRLRSATKFIAGQPRSYLGLENENIGGKMAEIINRCIDQFVLIAQNGGTEEDFQHAISNGLNYFDTSGYNLDTEDRERVCEYFEEMMDAVGLESSGGVLNKWMYGFDIG